MLSPTVVDTVLLLLCGAKHKWYNNRGGYGCILKRIRFFLSHSLSLLLLLIKRGTRRLTHTNGKCVFDFISRQKTYLRTCVPRRMDSSFDYILTDIIHREHCAASYETQSRIENCTTRSKSYKRKKCVIDMFFFSRESSENTEYNKIILKKKTQKNQVPTASFYYISVN